ncbi:MAG: putative glycosyltransferase [Acidobacteria bacterium]|nr:putative glycosyltransferase [Acidobacteriota bacterium]
MAGPMTVPTAPERPEMLGAVAAVVMAGSAERLAACLSAVGRQVYGPSQVFVVGGGDDVRVVAGRHEAVWRASLRALVGGLAPDTEFLWLLRDGARPRPDALSALLRDGARADASVAGSKILDAADPTVLVSVGYATDVFDAPYSGLQRGELDQQQYDVIRDVAAVSGVSMLVRLDLYRGLGGLDTSMAPMAAAVDFCQRARLRGARVVVVPSSEVLLEGREVSAGFRERAGELRAMQKAYSPITLAWAVPLAFASGLAESVGGPFLGRFPLFSFLGGWLWNLAFLPSTIVQHFAARRGRVVGDEELFRYQTGGSARLRASYDEGLERLRARFPEGVLSGFSDVIEAGQERLRRPAVVVVLAVIAFALLATRSIWTAGLPIVGFSLPPPESARATLGAYAGGWNPAGLGSPEVLRPEVAAVAVVQLLCFGHGGLAIALLTVAAFLCGAIGTGRLLRVWGIGPVAGYLAGTVLMAGPAALALAGDGGWAPMIALGTLPWAALAALAPWPKPWRRRLGRAAALALATGVVGIFAPAALPVPVLAVLLWALVGRGRRWPAVLPALAGALLALPLLMPWVLYTDLTRLYTDGAAAFWELTWLLAVAAGALALTVIAGDPAVSAVAGWGGLLTALGALLARGGDFGVGREAEQAGLIAAALGLAAVTGAALEAGARRRRLGGLRGAAGVVATLAALVLVGSTVVMAQPGRAGLPEDEYGDRLAFATAGGDSGARVLLFGPAADLPGTSRDFEGLGYRVVAPPYPESWDAYLGEPRLGDEALRSLLDELLTGEVRRAGERLAVFGIGWVAFTEPSPLEDVFDAQLDMVPLRGLSLPIFRNEVPATEAYGPGGAAWPRDGTGYTRPEGGLPGPVYVASNADYRWGPGEWNQADWANQVDTAGTAVRFAGHDGRRDLALGSAAWLGVLLALAAAGWWGRRRGQ